MKIPDLVKKGRRPFNAKLEPTETGLFDLPDYIYRRIKALNITYAKLFNQSPAHVWTAFNDPASIVSPTYAMEVGTAFHWLVLEPEKFEKHVKLDKALSKNSSDYKSWRQEVSSQDLVIKAADYVAVRTMADKMMEKKSVQKYIAPGGYREMAMLWFEPEFEIWCKGKIDFITIDGQALVDLKKTQNASKFGFLKSIVNYEYYTQAAHYMRGFETCMGYRPREWVWMAAEQKPPNESNVFVADPVEIDMAEDKVLTWYARFAECLRTGHWPGYPDEIIYLGQRHATGISPLDNINLEEGF